MKFVNQYSGSKGNLTVVREGGRAVLIDCGGGSGKIFPAIKSCGLSPSDVDAVLVTHEHSDHIGGMETLLAANPQIKVYVHAKGYAALVDKFRQYEGRIISFDSPFDAGAFRVEYYPCSHDSVYCCGYKLTDDKGMSVASVTDTGEVDDKTLLAFFNGCDTVLLESNHDVKMLTEGNYTAQLKKRILGVNGHLSNARAAQIVSRLPDINVKNVFLGHLSLDNNTEEIAFAESINALVSRGAVDGRDICVYVARQLFGGKEINVNR